MIKDNRESYRELIDVRLVETLREASIDNEAFSLDYELLQLPDDVDYELATTASAMVRTMIKLRNKVTGEYLEAPINLLEIPVYTQIGFKINGTSYQILDLYKRASGWYILHTDTNNGPRVEMELTPNRGFKLDFTFKDDKIKISTNTSKKNKNGTSKYVTLASFLKSITGHSYLELANMLGMTNKYVMMNFNEQREKSRSECITETLRLFATRGDQIAAINNKVLELNRRLFSKNFMNIGSASYVRLQKSTTFYTRALNKTLARDITVNGKTHKAGQLLHEDLLKEIDSSGLDTLFVRFNNKVYELKKYPISEDFGVNEILTMINMYCCALDGFDTADSRYELSNRVVQPFNDLVCERVSEILSDISQHISDELSSKSEHKGHLPAIVNNISIPATDRLIKEIPQKLNQAQTGDTTNIVAYASKNYKITTDYKGRGTEEMTRVQDSQLGLLDSIDSPESSKIGKVHHRGLLTNSDENGFLISPYYKIENGKRVSDEPVYLTADQKTNKYIATWEEEFDKPKAMAYYNGRVLSVPLEKIDYQEFSVLNNIGPARAHITFPNHSNGKRLLMGGNMMKQAVSTFKSQRPFVSTGAGALIDFGYYTARDVLSLYYIDHSTELEGQISYEDFIELELELIDTKIVPEYRKLNFTTYAIGRTLYPTVTVPFMKKNTVDCIYTTRINVKSGTKYQGDDIIAYNVGLDVKNYDVENYVNFGGVEVKDSDFQRDIAIGNNLIVAYKTFESSTIDDAIVLSSELVYDNTLTSITLKEVKSELKDEADYKEYFGFEKGYDENTMTPEGVPKVGVYLKPGSLVIAKYGCDLKKNKNSSTPDKTTIKDKSSYLDNVTEGQVVFAEVTDKMARVLVAEASPIEVGDKMAGRYGNKGVVAKIVDEKDMPYDPKTGMKVQVILNPLGIPSRMNISQVLECVLAYSMKKLDKVIVISPDREDNLDIVRKYAEMAGVKPMMLRDGRTGQMFKRPMNVGVLYMLKLEHMVRHKINAINIPTTVNKTLLQPRKGRSNEGGQAFGEMETWCLMSLGANKVLQDLMSLQSDDFSKRKYIEQYIQGKASEDQLKGDNSNDKFMQYFTRSMGIEVIPDKATGSYDIIPLTDKLIQALAERPLDTVNNPNWLHDPSIFGFTRPYKQIIDSRDKWGYIELNTKMIHPFWLIKSDINKLIIVKKIKTNGSDNAEPKLEYISSKDLEFLLKGSAGKKANKYINLTTEIPEVSDTKLNEQYTTGISAVIQLFETASLQTAREYYTKLVQNDRIKEDDLIKYSNMLNKIDLMEKRGFTFADLVITHFPIVPQVIRPVLASKNNVKQDFDIYYTNIDRAAKECKKYNSDLSKYKLYGHICAFIGYNVPSELRISQKKARTLLNFFTGKEMNNNDGLIRDNLLSKRLMFSGRTVIVPIRNPKIRPTQIGLPFAICAEMWELHIVSLLKNKYGNKLGEDIDYPALLSAMASKNMSKFNNILRITPQQIDYARDLYADIYEDICSFVEKQTVLSGRQPSLHRYSIRAFHPVVTSANAIEIHPLVCKGYNADFDGDQMWVAAMITDSASKQAFNLMSAESGILNPKDNSIILEHTQDIILGLYFATMLYDNKLHISLDDRYKNIRGYYDSLKAIELDVKAGMIEPQDLICYNYDGNKYLSTAGRILFNAILPNSFTDKPFTNPLDIPNIKAERFKELRFDGLVKKKADKSSKSVNGLKPLKTIALDSIIKELFAEVKSSELVEISHLIYEFGIYYSDISGISLTLDDLVEHPLTQVYIDKAKALEDKVNQDYADGLITEEGRKKVVITIYTEVRERLSKVFFDAFDRNNNLFIMADSGARGNLSQMMQTCGIVGVISKSSSETLETPVLGNYAKGLRSYETHLVSHGTRMGVASTQNETSKAGYSTRQAVHMCNNFKIVAHDCGKTDYRFKVRYTSPREGSFEKLLGKHLLSSDETCMKLVRNMIGLNNKIDSDCANVLLKHGIRTVYTKEGIIDIDYEMDKLTKSLLLFRESPKIEGMEDLPYLVKGRFISEKTIDYIEKHGLEYISARTMLDCKGSGGVCAKCYGLRYDTMRLPKTGENVGIESAQSIGEPSAQLTMNTFHGGGIAGTSVTGGVAFFEGLLQGSVPSSTLEAIVAQESGYVSLDEVGNTTTIELNGSYYKIHKGLVLVKDGEYVEEGQPMTIGTIVPDTIGKGNNELWNIRRRQLALLDLYFGTFMSNNIYINARHFEVLVRMQSSLVRVVNSDNPKYKPGQTHFLADIVKANSEGSNIAYQFKIARQTELISHYSGALTALSFQDFSGVLSKVIFDEVVQGRPTSPIGKLFVGQDLTEDTPKNLARPKYVSHYNIDVDAEVAPTLASDTRAIIETIKEQTNSGLDLADMFNDISLDDILSGGMEIPANNDEEIYINMEDTGTHEDKNSKTIRKDTSGLDAF